MRPAAFCARPDTSHPPTTLLLLHLRPPPTGVGTYVLQVELELLLVRLKLVSQLVAFVVECKQALKKSQELERDSDLG